MPTHLVLKKTGGMKRGRLFSLSSVNLDSLQNSIQVLGVEEAVLQWGYHDCISLTMCPLLQSALFKCVYPSEARLASSLLNLLLGR